MARKTPYRPHPLLDHIIRRREVDKWTFPQIGRELGEASGSLQAIYARHYHRLGIEQPVVGRVPAVRLGAPMFGAPTFNPTPEPIAVAGTPGVATMDQSPVSQRVVVPCERRAGWRQSILVTADHHWDHVLADRDLLKHHLAQARERQAGVVMVGDIFCLMQGKMDKRGGKPELRSEYLVDHYADAVVDSAAQWYEPYADLLWLATYGNHEGSYQSHHETDVLARWVKELNRHAGGSILLGAYTGWLSVELDFGDGTSQLHRSLYHHGWGGGGPVTLGVIGTNRMAAQADYDSYLQGHIHEKWVVWRTRQTIGHDGQLVVRDVPHICAGPYKADGASGKGWHPGTGKPLKPMGGYWLHLDWSERQGCVVPKTEEADL